jgi:soluble lytic murein transglycosylase
LGLKDWRWSQVTEIDTNVSLGTYYLRHVLDTLDGQPVLASAAYNAGPGRARNWRPGVAIEGAIYAETIPFNETRDYVKKVMSNATYYAHTLGEQMQ